MGSVHARGCKPAGRIALRCSTAVNRASTVKGGSPLLRRQVAKSETFPLPGCVLQARGMCQAHAVILTSLEDEGGRAQWQPLVKCLPLWQSASWLPWIVRSSRIPPNRPAWAMACPGRTKHFDTQLDHYNLPSALRPDDLGLYQLNLHMTPSGTSTPSPTPPKKGKISVLQSSPQKFT